MNNRRYVKKKHHDNHKFRKQYQAEYKNKKQANSTHYIIKKMRDRENPPLQAEQVIVQANNNIPNIPANNNAPHIHRRNRGLTSTQQLICLLCVTGLIITALTPLMTSRSSQRKSIRNYGATHNNNNATQYAGANCQSAPSMLYGHQVSLLKPVN